MNGSSKKKPNLQATRSGETNKGGSGGQKNVFKGIKIDNDPLEREIYVRCPSCNHKVFDSGLENELW